MIVTRLDDQNDILLADYRNVPDPDLVARRGLFVAEGRLVVRRLLTQRRVKARSVMVTEAAFAALEDVFTTHADLPVFVVGQHVMNTINGFNMHRGCLALGERPSPLDWREIASRARRLAVLEAIGNVDNIGSLFRNAAAFGADAILLGPSCADPFYRKAIRTAMGAVFSIPFATVDEWPGGLAALRTRGYATVGMTPAGDAAMLCDVAVAVAGRPWAMVLGHEGDGLTAAALDACEFRARIPMATGVDSLNVATAAAIGFYELTRR
jgi:tRNA G18 (ribose-2'-O)-methylase SpoU